MNSCLTLCIADWLNRRYIFCFTKATLPQLLNRLNASKIFKKTKTTSCWQLVEFLSTQLWTLWRTFIQFPSVEQKNKGFFFCVVSPWNTFIFQYVFPPKMILESNQMFPFNYFAIVSYSFLILNFISGYENRCFAMFCCCSHSFTNFLWTWQTVSIHLFWVDFFPYLMLFLCCHWFLLISIIKIGSQKVYWFFNFLSRKKNSRKIWWIDKIRILIIVVLISLFIFHLISSHLIINHRQPH